jgi:hypothetical protein
VLAEGIYEKDKNGRFKLEDGARVKNKKREERKIAAHWQCYSNTTQQMEPIEEDALLEYVSAKFLENLKRNSATGCRKFSPLPPGDSKVHLEFPEGFVKGPVIHYRQPAGERICVVASFASFLHSVNCRQHAAQLFSVKNNIQESLSVWFNFCSYLQKLSPELQLQKYNFEKFDVNSLVSPDKFGFPDLPIVTCVVDSNGQDDHCITIYKDWIYDGNFSHALPLKKESLDLCCSSDEYQRSFVAMKSTYIIPRFNFYLMKNQNRDKSVQEKNKKYSKKKRKRKDAEKQRKCLKTA